MKLNLNLNVESDPKIHLNEELINNSKIKNKITDTKLNILLGIGGSGPTKRVPSKIFIEFMELISKNNDCNFF